MFNILVWISIRYAAALFLLGFATMASATIETTEVRVPLKALSSGTDHLRGFVINAPDGRKKPGVVLLHGCNGIETKSGGVNSRILIWARFLAENGYLALIVDSFSTRGEKELCTKKFSNRTISVNDRVGDAFAALNWLSDNPDVDAKQLFLIGWSHGGSVTLKTITDDGIRSTGLLAAVAFYPGCGAVAREQRPFSPKAPLLVLMGDSDDWTPPKSCERIVKAARASGADAEIILYPGAYHAFDQPGDGPLRFRSDIATGSAPGGGAHVGPNPAAREHARKAVLDFFRSKR